MYEAYAGNWRVFKPSGSRNRERSERLTARCLSCDSGRQIYRCPEYIAISLDDRAVVQSCPRYGKGSRRVALGQQTRERPEGRSRGLGT